jgi:2-dehydro-3-deoxygluconokinase
MSRALGGMVLCVGEPLIVLTPEPGESIESAQRLIVAEGGAELNVAVHLARLGWSVRFAGRVGADPLGRRLSSVLIREGVDVSALAFDPELPTGLYLKEPGQGASTVYYFRRGSAATVLDRLPDRALDGVVHLHVTGIMAALSDACRGLVQGLLARPRPITVSFDINYRPALWEPAVASSVLMDLARGADIVFVGLDEARQLWGVDRPEGIRSLLPEPAEVVVKDGPRPAVAYLLDRPPVVEPALAVEVVEPVGAGDAFAAGYLATRLGGGDVRSALRLGHALASQVLRTRSDHGVAPESGLVPAVRGGQRLVPGRRSAGAGFGVGAPRAKTADRRGETP